MQKSKNNAYNLKEKGRLLARSISQTDVLYYTRSYFPLTYDVWKVVGKREKEPRVFSL